nr:MAG TPA: hypothetical protein [Caudoviricetes sp.]
MSETPDSAIYPDGPQYYTGSEASPEPATPAEQPAAQQPSQQPGAAEGELFVTNLLAEIANLTKRAIMAETMVAVLQAQQGKK